MSTVIESKLENKPEKERPTTHKTGNGKHGNKIMYEF